LCEAVYFDAGAWVSIKLLLRRHEVTPPGHTCTIRSLFSKSATTTHNEHKEQM